MTIASWILEGIFFWVGGYLYTKNKLDERLLNAPKWLFLLCGFPNMKSSPSGIITLGGLFLQLWGWILVIYGLISGGNHPDMDIVGQLAGILIGGISARAAFGAYKIEQ